ncbi:MAG TPA: M48 family metalloprotease [Polyangiales bacterium]|nr:M48 family metalloprotease [Polyangiales bacterium]
MRDFFEQQAIAQRRTRLLLLCMLLSVVALGSVPFAVLSALRALLRLSAAPLWPLFAWSVGITAALIAIAGLFRTLSLREGGSCIAEMLDARLVSGQPQDALDRRLLNVVAEMALAAGIPVPQVYVLDREPGINGFAAGWDLGDSVICVTRGCLHKLTRNELQGVVAHEFSHLMHGDARLNLRLMGAVFGMVSLGLLGRHLMRGSNWGERKDGSMIVIGGSLALIGALGGLLGNLVKSAVSRQREYLADASAVQFTRHPDGIARALKKIGGYVLGARLSSVRVEELEHFFLEETGGGSSWAWLTTHPPLRERIRRLDPSFDGQFIEPAEGLAEAVADVELTPLPAAAALLPPLTAARVMPLIGTSQAEPATPELPAGLKQAAENSFSACGLTLAMLVSADRQVALRQAAQILEIAGPTLLSEAQRLHPAVREASRLERLTLATLAAPALRALSRDQKNMQKRCVAALIAEDGATSIFELVLSYMLSAHWQKRHLPKRAAGLANLKPAVQLVLSCLAHTGASFDDSATSAFQAASARLPDLDLSLLPQHPRLLSGFTTALDELQVLRPTARAALIEACAHAVVADSRVTEDELTLLRAVCLALDAPLPPLEARTALTATSVVA